MDITLTEAVGFIKSTTYNRGYEPFFGQTTLTLTAATDPSTSFEVITVTAEE